MNNYTPTRLAAAVVLAMMVTACGSVMRSEYQRPAMTLPEQWQEATPTASQIPARWWQVFQDPQLDRMLTQLRQSNPDLAKAGISLYKARLTAQQTATNAWPTPTVGLNAQSSKPLAGGGSSKSFTGSAALSYELDLWGKLASPRAVPHWLAVASDDDRQATELSMMGTAAGLYWQIGYLNQAISLSEESLQDTRKVLQLVKSRYQAGAIGEQDLVSAEQEVASQQATVIDYRRQRVAQRNALAILFDAPPEAWLPELDKLEALPVPSIPAGLPASVLGNRPDLRASEARLRSALASTDAAKLNLYPALSLTATAGSESSALGHLLSDPVATLGAGLTLPFVDWQNQSLAIDLADADYQTAVVNFRQDLYQALSEVETELNAGQHYAQQGELLKQQWQWAHKRAQIALSRYRNGATDVQDWLDARASERTAALAWAQNHLNRLNSSMSLLKALGGAGYVQQQPGQ